MGTVVTWSVAVDVGGEKAMNLLNLGFGVGRDGLGHGDGGGLRLAQEGIVINGGNGTDVGGCWDTHGGLGEVGARPYEFSVAVCFNEHGHDAGVEDSLALVPNAGAIRAAHDHSSNGAFAAAQSDVVNEVGDGLCGWWTRLGGLPEPGDQDSVTDGEIKGGDGVHAQNTAMCAGCDDKGDGYREWTDGYRNRYNSVNGHERAVGSLEAELGSRDVDERDAGPD